MLKMIKSKFSKVKICSYTGCTELFIARKHQHIYCSKHRGGINIGVGTGNYQRKQKLSMTGKSKVALRDRSTGWKDREYERKRALAISNSPLIDELICFTPDNGKTLIYCKDGEQLNRAREAFRYLYTRSSPKPKEQ